MKNYFGTDGIRFIYQEELNSFISKIAKAINDTYSNLILIGMDTRYSSNEICSLLLGQLTNKEVKIVGICSTPCLIYLSKKYNCLAIMITASHNPSEYNGLKLIDKGFKINKKEQLKLSKLISSYENININKELVIKEDPFYLNDYLDFLNKEIKPSHHRFVFDVGHGSLCNYIEKIIYKINPHNIVINNDYNGYNINTSGAVNPNILQQYLIKNNIEYGFCFDGDADRLILVSKNKIYTGNQILFILCKYYKIDKVVLTKYISLLEEDSFKKESIKIFKVDNGDQEVLSKCLKEKIILGGEDSGHIILLNKILTGDGLLNAITLINIMEQYSIDNLLKDYQVSNNELINLKIQNKDIINNPILIDLINKLNITFKNKASIFIRLSGTENKLRIFISTYNKQDINIIKDKLITYIKLIDNEIICSNFDLISIDENSTFGKDVILNGNVIINNSKISSNCEITSSKINDSIISNNCKIGPFSHIRNNSLINENVRIGNFVEIKNSLIGKNTKISHLSYIGDCLCGDNVNIGCGVITVNYDGKNKYKTIIGSNSFIGCNSNLIAPIEIGESSMIAAGSTLTKSTNKNSFTIARSKQITKENKASNYPYFQEK